MMASINTNKEPLPQPSTILQGKQTRMYSLDTNNKNFTITPDDNYQENKLWYRKRNINNQ